MGVRRSDMGVLVILGLLMLGGGKAMAALSSGKRKPARLRN